MIPAAAAAGGAAQGSGSGQPEPVLGEKRKRKPSSKAQGQQDEATQRAAKAAAVPPARQPYMRWNDELDSVIVSFAETAAAATSLDCAAVLSALKAHPDCPLALTATAQVASRIGALRKRGVLAALPDKPSAGADLPFLPEGATLESVTAHINVHMRTFFGGVTANHTVLSPDVSREWAARVHGEVVVAMGVFEGHKQLIEFWKRLTAALT